MLLSDAEDLAGFIKELQKETDRGLALVCASLIDEKLLALLRVFLIDKKSSKKLLIGMNAPLGTFSSRIEACCSLGLISELEYQEIHLIRKIRNFFAHTRHNIGFETNPVIGYCSNLKVQAKSTEEDTDFTSRKKFIGSSVQIVLDLIVRYFWVKQNQSKEMLWPNKYPENYFIRINK